MLSVEQHHPEEYPFRMEFGTPNLPGIAGLHAGVKWVLSRGMGAIHDGELMLWKLLRDGLRGIDGVTLYCADGAEDRLGVLAFNVDGVTASQVGAILDVDHDIAARTGLHCAPLVHESLGTIANEGAVRFSLGPFNTQEEVQMAIAAVTRIARQHRSR
ncbi:MAG: aminotransferase class V-fold PLP-dependent enzyme [Deltaproteobacteria bacterium]|nr:aminotransferase class V-fold PLP-dependent enzyme [Deltaproteobacteria bacterium]